MLCSPVAPVLRARLRSRVSTYRSVQIRGASSYLLRELKIDRANQVWATDITYIPMACGWVYLCAIVDCASRRVLSHRVSISMDASFCVEALEEAFSKYG